MRLLILLSYGLCCLIRSISVIFLIAGLFYVNNSREGDVGVIFMFVNSRVAFWVLKVFDSTETNFPSGFANVGYLGIGAIHARSSCMGYWCQIEISWNGYYT